MTTSIHLRISRFEKPDFDIISYFKEKIKGFLKKILNFYFRLVFSEKVCYTINKNAQM